MLSKKKRMNPPESFDYFLLFDNNVLRNLITNHREGEESTNKYIHALNTFIADNFSVKDISSQSHIFPVYFPPSAFLESVGFNVKKIMAVPKPQMSLSDLNPTDRVRAVLRHYKHFFEKCSELKRYRIIEFIAKQKEYCPKLKFSEDVFEATIERWTTDNDLKMLRYYLALDYTQIFFDEHDPTNEDAQLQIIFWVLHAITEGINFGFYRIVNSMIKGLTMRNSKNSDSTFNSKILQMEISKIKLDSGQDRLDADLIHASVFGQYVKRLRRMVPVYSFTEDNSTIIKNRVFWHKAATKMLADLIAKYKDDAQFEWQNPCPGRIFIVDSVRGRIKETIDVEGVNELKDM